MKKLLLSLMLILSHSSAFALNSLESHPFIDEELAKMSESDRNLILEGSPETFQKFRTELLNRWIHESEAFQKIENSQSSVLDHDVSEAEWFMVTQKLERDPNQRLRCRNVNIQGTSVCLFEIKKLTLSISEYTEFLAGLNGLVDSNRFQFRMPYPTELDVAFTSFPDLPPPSIVQTTEEETKVNEDEINQMSEEVKSQFTFNFKEDPKEQAYLLHDLPNPHDWKCSLTCQQSRNKSKNRTFIWKKKRVYHRLDRKFERALSKHYSLEIDAKDPSSLGNFYLLSAKGKKHGKVGPYLVQASLNEGGIEHAIGLWDLSFKRDIELPHLQVPQDSPSDLYGMSKIQRSGLHSNMDDLSLEDAPSPSNDASFEMKGTAELKVNSVSRFRMRDPKRFQKGKCDLKCPELLFAKGGFFGGSYIDEKSKSDWNVGYWDYDRPKMRIIKENLNKN